MKARDISAIAFFAAFITVLGFLPALFVPYLPLVPLSVHTLAIFLSGAVLGAKRGFYAVGLYWLLLLCGFATAGGSSGAAAFIGPMGGYIIGFGLAAYAIGICYDRCPNPNIAEECLFMAFGGIALLYLPGILWLTLLTKMSFRDALMLNLLFLPWDCVKIAVAVFVRRNLHRRLPQAFR